MKRVEIVEISIVGAGRVGQTLCRALKKQRIRIGAIVNRSAQSARRAAEFIGGGRPADRLEDNFFHANVVLIGVPDPRISDTARDLARIGGFAWKDKVVLHFSGSRTSAELSSLARLGAHCGSLHPILPLPRRLNRLPNSLFCGIEGDLEAMRCASRLTRCLRAKPIKIDCANKALYHAAIALVGGHLMALVETAAQMLTYAGVPRKLAANAIVSPIFTTLSQYKSYRADAWTGPISRADLQTLSLHLSAFKKLPRNFGDLYRFLGLKSLDAFAPPGSKKYHPIARRLKG
jgi:predicted short-subunit dehydrogenase-like oxidoreductase (DUF2520 family)